MTSDITASREIRVFLSSTFSDMQAERDYLVKKIFPAIRRECRRRNVEFTVLDLRWGITEEEAKTGRVVEICMDEISRTRPFFIGLIGGRYGWVPDDGESDLNTRLLIRYPHVRDGIRQGKSITEMEMLYGVLDYPEKTYSHFFIRSLRSVPRKYLDKPGTEAAEKREKLKATVRAAAEQGRCTVSDYTSVKELGRAVSEALMSTIEQLYPMQEKYSALDMTMAAHDAAIAGLRKVYVGRDVEFDEERLDGDPQLFTLYAPSGYGKSAWIANNWSDEDAIVHTMIGGGIDSAEMCRRALAYELRRRFPEFLGDISLDLPAEGQIDLKGVLHKLPGVEIVWAIDGIERLVNVADRSMVWLKDIYPSEISHVIITSSDEELMDEVSRNLGGSKDIHLLDLRESQKMKLTELYLRTFAKGLTASQRATIANDPELASPGVLRIFLNEMLQFGVYENLDAFMARYLDAPDMVAFLDCVLQRIDGDFDPGRVSALLNLLRLSRYGLYEEDVQEHLGMKPVDWAALYNAVEEFIGLRSGRLSLKAGDYADVVMAHYPVDATTERKYRRDIIGIASARFKKARKTMRSRMERFDRVLDSVMFTFPTPFDADAGLQEQAGASYAEIASQLAALGKYKKLVGMIRNFNIGNFCNYQGDLLPILQLLKEKNVSLSSFVGMSAILFSAVLGEVYITLFRMYIASYGRPGDVAVVRRRIRLAPLPSGKKRQLLAMWDGKTEQKAFIDLWDEDDFFNSCEGIIPRMFELFTMAWDSDVAEIYAKLKRTHAKHMEQKEEGSEPVTFLLDAMLAVAGARCRDYGNAVAYADEMTLYNTMSNPLAVFVDYYIDCLIPDRKNRALSDYDKLQAKAVASSITLEVYRVIGDALYNAHNEASIVRLVEESFEQQAANPDLARNIGDVLFAAKKYRGAVSALRAYERLTDLADEKLSCTYKGGRAAAEAGDYNTAVEMYSRNLELMRQHPEIAGWDEALTIGRLSEACGHIGRHDEAIDYARQRLELLKKATPIVKDMLSGAYNNLAVRHNSKAYTIEGEERVSLMRSAIGYYEEAYKLAPQDMVIKFNIASTRLSLYKEGELSETEFAYAVSEMEEIYKSPAIEDSLRRLAAGELANAYSLGGDWDKLVDLIDNSGYQKLVGDYDEDKARILSGSPEQRRKVADKYVSVIIYGGDCRCLSFLDTVAERMEKFGLVADVIDRSELFISSNQDMENIIAVFHYIAIKLSDEELGRKSGEMLLQYMSQCSGIVSRLPEFAEKLLRAEGVEVNVESRTKRVEELRAVLAEKVLGSQEQLLIKELQWIDLDALCDDEAVASKFIDDITGKPWQEQVLTEIIARLYKADRLWHRSIPLLRRLAPLLAPGVASDDLRAHFELLLDGMSRNDYIQEFDSSLKADLYPLYEAAGLPPSGNSVLIYLDYIEDTQGLEAAIGLYQQKFISLDLGLDYTFAIMLRRAGRHDEAEEIVNRKIAETEAEGGGDNNDEMLQYWLVEKLRICRNTGRYHEAVDIYHRVKELDYDERYVNFWMVASAFAYAGMNEEALAILEKESSRYALTEEMYMECHREQQEREEHDREMEEQMAAGSYDDDIEDEESYDEVCEEYQEDPVDKVFPFEDELDYFYAVLLKSVIYFRMGNETLGREVWRNWEGKAVEYEATGHAEVPLLALREIELGRLAMRKGDRREAECCAVRAGVLASKGTKSYFVNNVLADFKKELATMGA